MCNEVQKFFQIRGFSSNQIFHFIYPLSSHFICKDLEGFSIPKSTAGIHLHGRKKHTSQTLRKFYKNDILSGVFRKLAPVSPHDIKAFHFFRFDVSSYGKDKQYTHKII